MAFLFDSFYILLFIYSTFPDFYSKMIFVWYCGIVAEEECLSHSGRIEKNETRRFAFHLKFQKLGTKQSKLFRVFRFSLQQLGHFENCLTTSFPENLNVAIKSQERHATFNAWAKENLPSWAEKQREAGPCYSDTCSFSIFSTFFWAEQPVDFDIKIYKATGIWTSKEVPPLGESHCHRAALAPQWRLFGGWKSATGQGQKYLDPDLCFGQCRGASLWMATEPDATVRETFLLRGAAQKGWGFAASWGWEAQLVQTLLLQPVLWLCRSTGTCNPLLRST